MAAPVVVALTDDFTGLVTAHLQGQGYEVTVDDVGAALSSAARFEDPKTPQPDLFREFNGGES